MAMRKLALAAMVAACGAAGAAAGAGCEGGGMNSPFKKYTKEEQLAATAARSYTEVKRDNVIYVVSTPDAVKAVKAGKEPAMKVAAIGFGPAGEKVIFEASKDGLENGLMKEFDKRHGASRS